MNEQTDCEHGQHGEYEFNEIFDGLQFSRFLAEQNERANRRNAEVARHAHAKRAASQIAGQEVHAREHCRRTQQEKD